MRMDLLDVGASYKLKHGKIYDDHDESFTEDDEAFLTDELESYHDGEDQSATRGYGTGTLISAISKLPTLTSDNIYDVFVINVATLIRNNTVKGRLLTDIVNTVKKDVFDLIHCICRYHENMGPLIKNPKAVFYLPDYSYLPPLHARPATGHRATIKDVTEMLVKEDNLKVRKRIRSREGITDFIEIYAGSKIELPYRTIIGELNSLYKMEMFDPRASLSKYLLISHVPLDYYFMLTYPRVTMLESFTGKFFKPKRLGFKVFGTNFIPFNQVTHLLFGDKALVRPMAMRKNRNLLIDLAKRQQWYVRTPYEIERYVAATQQVPAGILTRLKF